MSGMNNIEVAKVFEDIAELLEVKGENQFKIRAYQKAAHHVARSPVEVEQLVAEDRLREIPGVGEAIAKKITELITTGKLKFYEDLKAEIPEGISELLSIHGVGPKIAHKLVTELGITTVEELEQAIIDGRVAQLDGMGEKTAENILRRIKVKGK